MQTIHFGDTETPKGFSLTSIWCHLHRCGTVRQKFCSAKPTLWDFEACTLFQKQVPSGRLLDIRDTCQDYHCFTCTDV